MSERKRIVKRKAKSKASRPLPQQNDAAVDPSSKRRFDQLLDDAIFGVKKKNQRG